MHSDLSGIQPLLDISDQQENPTISHNGRLTQPRILDSSNITHLRYYADIHPQQSAGMTIFQSSVRYLILDDFLVKTGRLYPILESTVSNPSRNRVLFAPDNKVASNLFKLMDQDAKYSVFLPEFPLLHLRKSKITTLMGGYKNAGLLHLVKYMRDEEQEDDWAKLISAANIDAATRFVKRIALAIHTALVMKFMETLPPDQSEQLLLDLQAGNVSELVDKWNVHFDKFVAHGCKVNATFSLHVDMLKHCEEVIAISFAEKVGGPSGYNLLLASVKSSLPFAFLNGAASYAAFSTRLLCEHYSAGTFHQHLKMALFTTPHKGSKSNLGLDTQREMDHRDALKGFRPGATIKAVVPRMSLVDYFGKIHEQRIKKGSNGSSKTEVPELEEDHEDSLKSSLASDTDLGYIMPLVSLIMRRGGLNLIEDPIPKNVYTKIPSILS